MCWTFIKLICLGFYQVDMTPISINLICLQIGYSGSQKNPGFLKAFFPDSIFSAIAIAILSFPGILPPRFLVFCFPSLSGYLIIWISSFFFFPHGYSGSQKNPGFLKAFFPDSIFFRDRDRDFKFPRYPSSSIPPLRVSSGFRIWKSF